VAQSHPAGSIGQVRKECRGFQKFLEVRSELLIAMSIFHKTDQMSI
jgi:hypothetical protein